jgi:hypothetical protein
MERATCSGNRALGNLGGGIDVSGTETSVSGSEAFGNSPRDLRDGNGAGCDANTWTGSRFGISDPPAPSCIE